MTTDPSWHDRPAGQQYTVGPVFFFLQLVLRGGTSLRAAGRLFPLLRASLGCDLGTPHWTSGRWWLLRLGLAHLQEPKERASDWVWMVDHSAQIGTEKCLVVLGVRLVDLPPLGQCLGHEHVRLLHLRVLINPDHKAVGAELEEVAARTGEPRAILDDHGNDIRGGVEWFQERHPATIEIYDITHKGACLLKHRLEKDPRWSAFGRQVGQAKLAVQQTEWACLVPPNQRSKSRYLNLDTLLAWGTKTLAVVDRPPEALLRGRTAARLEEKLGWLRGYRDALAEWSEWQALVSATAGQVRRRGLSVDLVAPLVQELEPLATRPSSRELATALVEFVEAQASQCRVGERLPGSTEVLESLFGKVKALEKDQAKNGFTGLVLSLGAMVWKTTAAVVQRALAQCPLKRVWGWCAENLGPTVQAQRRLAYQR